MDVVQIEKTGENFRIIYDVKGRFTVHRCEVLVVVVVRDMMTLLSICYLRSMKTTITFTDYLDLTLCYSPPSLSNPVSYPPPQDHRL